MHLQVPVRSVPSWFQEPEQDADSEGFGKAVRERGAHARPARQLRPRGLHRLLRHEPPGPIHPPSTVPTQAALVIVSTILYRKLYVVTLYYAISILNFKYQYS